MTTNPHNRLNINFKKKKMNYSIQSYIKHTDLKTKKIYVYVTLDNLRSNTFIALQLSTMWHNHYTITVVYNFFFKNTVYFLKAFLTKTTDCDTSQKNFFCTILNYLKKTYTVTSGELNLKFIPIFT